MTDHSGTPATATGAALWAEDVRVSFGAVVALAGCTLRVARGECVALLGPSGSGKTTLLHVVAGFVQPDHGTVRIGEQVMVRPGFAAPPERRQIGFVFQSYALWPHLNVLETVMYPMARRGVKRAAAETRARDLLARLGMDALLARHPAQLSGGQQQRVGLARALAAQPQLFLFDEPTANLDAALKATFQEEIARQQRASGAGALYVTHDPQEAFTVADRIVVLREGRLIQEADPLTLYHCPADPWVAGLTGRYSLLDGTFVEAGDGWVSVRIGERIVRCAGALAAPSPAGDAVRVLVRPEWVRLAFDGGKGFDNFDRSDNGDNGEGFAARIAAVRFGGPHTDYTLDTRVGTVTARAVGPPQGTTGTAITWTPERVWLLPARLP